MITNFGAVAEERRLSRGKLDTRTTGWRGDRTTGRPSNVVTAD
jgi:hypothetical protein